MITLLSIIGYLTVGLVVARAFVIVEKLHRRPDFDDYMFIMLIVVFWGIAAPFAILAGLTYGIGKLLTLPPRRERQTRRLARTRSEIAKLEQELGIREP